MTTVYKKIKNIFSGADKSANQNEAVLYRFSFEEIELIKSISSKNKKTVLKICTVNSGKDEIALFIPSNNILDGINEVLGGVIEAADPRKTIKPARIVLQGGQFIGYTLF